MNTEYDLVIVGGGLVGLSLLLACARLNLKVALIEAKSPQDHQKNNQQNNVSSAIDERSLVLALGSKLFYEDLGVWDKIEPYTTEIKKIIISEQGNFSKVFLKHNDFLVPALGYVINIDKLYQIIWQQVYNYAKIYSSCKVIDLKVYDNSVELLTDYGQEKLGISAKMIIAADGARSYIRDLMKISYEQHDYQQVAMIANVEHEQENSHTAYERFSKQGAFALLPRVNNKNISGIVWPHSINELDELKNSSDQHLILKLHNLFGYKLGRFINIGTRQFFPLWRVCSKELYKNRIMLMGSAANNIHPIGGQGFNLAVRDIKVFSQLLVDNQQKIIDGKYNLDVITRFYAEYAALRKPDHNSLLISTHGLLNIFASDNSLVKIGRNVGMTMLNNSYLLRNLIAQKSMGL